MTPETALEPLSGADHDMLLACEAVIESGQTVFIEVAQALVLVRDRKLWRESYKSFESYCQERWNFGKSQAYRLIAAGEVADNVPVETERQARELVGLEPEIQIAVHSIAEEIADGRPITTALLRDVREGVESEVKDILQAHVTDPADGDQKPLSVVMRANVIHKVYEDMQQRKEMIRSKMDQRTRKAHEDKDQKAVPAQPPDIFLMYTLRYCVRAMERMRQETGKLPPRLFNAFHFAKSVIGEPEEGSELALLVDEAPMEGLCESCFHNGAAPVFETRLTVAAENHLRSLKFKICVFCVDVYKRIVDVTPNAEVTG